MGSRALFDFIDDNPAAVPPRIVPQLKSGAGVVTTRAHVHYIVTEYGVADLAGKTLYERAKALIKLAHPDDREGLEIAWRELGQ